MRVQSQIKRCSEGMEPGSMTDITVDEWVFGFVYF